MSDGFDNHFDWYQFEYTPVTDRFGTIPRPVGTYYPVTYANIESYGDLTHRIRMIYTFTLTGQFGMTESNANRIIKSKRFSDKIRQAQFHACPSKSHMIQIDNTGIRPRRTDTRIAVRILGYQVKTHAEPDKTKICLSGLQQAREELKSRNSSDQLMGYALDTGKVDLIDSGRLHDPRAPWNQDSFDTGVCTCQQDKGRFFQPLSLLWTK